MKSIIKEIFAFCTILLALAFTIFTVDAYLENETHDMIYNAFIATLNYIAFCVDLIIYHIKKNKESS